VADPALIETTPEPDAIELIQADHRTVEGLFARFEGLRGTREHDQMRSVVESIARELRVHADMEEQVFYPSIRTMLAEGDRLADEAVEEHAEVRSVLAEIELMAVDDPGFETKVTTLVGDVRHHVKEEEGEILPRLRQAVGENFLYSLGREMAGAKLSVMMEEGAASGASFEPPSIAPPQPEPQPEPLAARKPATRKAATRKAPTRKRPTARKKASAAGKRASRPTTAKKSAAKKTTSRKPTAKKTTAKRTTARSTSRARTRYRVKPSPRGWQVTKQGASRASGTYPTQREAVRRGKELAKKAARGQLIVHGQDGKIKEEFTYGDDPRARKG
jgi:hemerythrin superfamily protein